MRRWPLQHGVCTNLPDAPSLSLSTRLPALSSSTSSPIPACSFAAEGLPTLVVSTDPAHSISDAFDQDLSGGAPVPVRAPGGAELPLWGLQLSPEVRAVAVLWPCWGRAVVPQAPAAPLITRHTSSMGGYFAPRFAPRRQRWPAPACIHPHRGPHRVWRPTASFAQLWGEGLHTYVVVRVNAGSVGLCGGVRVPHGCMHAWADGCAQAAKEELRAVLADDGGAKITSMLDSVGLGGVSEQLKDLQLGQLLDTPPPGVDEAIAIAKVRACVCGACGARVCLIDTRVFPAQRWQAS